MDSEKVIKESEEAIDILAKAEEPTFWMDFVRCAFENALTVLKEQEAVVRCKDCRYGQYCTDGETTYQCFKWNSGEFGMLHEQNWFCADGERNKGR